MTWWQILAASTIAGIISGIVSALVIVLFLVDGEEKGPTH